MPFTLRAGNEREWRMGIIECVKHNLFIEYPVLYEQKDEFVAQYKFTAMMISPHFFKANANIMRGL